MSEERTLAEMAAAAQGTEPMQIAGKPAVKCPYCGAGMFVNRTESLSSRTDRYECCRSCRRTFITRQPAKVFVREIGVDDAEISSAGNGVLNIYRDAG